MTGAVSLREGCIPTGMGLLAVIHGERIWEQAGGLTLHCKVKQALAETKLPERPDYEVANGLLIGARRQAVKP